MPPQGKPYRRFRARGSGGASGGLDALRALTQGAGPAERPSPPPEADPWAPAPRRRWWSLRGIGAWGWAWRVAAVLALGVVTWGVLGFLSVRGAVSEANARITPAARTALSPAGPLLSSPQNTLVVGIDARPGETRARADTIMVMRTDPGAGKVKWLSIPRDFRVELPGVGTERINAAHYFAGQRGIINAVRDLTGLPIQHIVVVRFNGVRRMVDELGGVTVNNPTALRDCPYPGGTTVSFPRGQVRLDGDRALQFVRVRKCDSDFHRAARQQAFVTALKGTLASVGSVPFAPWNGAAAVRSIGTDMGLGDLLKIGWLQWRLQSDPGDRIVLAGMARNVGGVSYVVGEPDLEERQIARFVGR